MFEDFAKHNGVKPATLTSSVARRANELPGDVFVLTAELDEVEDTGHIAERDVPAPPLEYLRCPSARVTRSSLWR